MPVTKDEFRAAMSRFASGVSVVTTKKDDGKLEGITVSAFSSLSLDPPLVLICIGKGASIHDSLNEGRYFAVNILAEDQELLSRRFASRDEDRFGGVGYKESLAGSPLLDGALCHVECRVVHTYPRGDHTIVVGEVETAIAAEGKPLVYFRGGYARLA